MRSIASLIAVALLATGLAGCQQLFTTSLGKSLARDDLPIPSDLTADQAAELAALAKDNQKLASALVESLVDQIAATTDAEKKASLQASAASAAIVASGTSEALTGLIEDYANDVTPDTQTLIDLVKTIQAGAQGTGVVTALSYLDPTAEGGLSADAAKAAGLGATDLAIAAVVVAAGALPADIDPTNMDQTQIDAFQATPEFQTASNIIEAAAALVETGSDSAKLLDDIRAKFGLSTTTP
jgi:hypothetical protein